MAYGHLDTVCAPRRKRNEDSFNRRLLRYCVAMASLRLLYHRGELSLRSWYRAEQIVADRYRLAEDSLFRKWHPDYDKDIVAQRAERLLYIQET